MMIRPVLDQVLLVQLVQVWFQHWLFPEMLCGTMQTHLPCLHDNTPLL